MPRNRKDQIRLAVTAGCALLTALAACALPGAGLLWCTLAQAAAAVPVFVYSAPLFAEVWQALRARRLAGTLPMLAGVLLLAGGGLAGVLPAGVAAAAWVLALQAGAAPVQALLLARLRPAPVAGLPAAVAVGEPFTVPAGGVIPADGVVRQGISTVEEDALTGLAGTAEVYPGSGVRAGTVNGGGTLCCVAERVGEDTAAAAAARRAAQAAESEPPQAEAAAREGARLVPVVLAVAAVVAVVWLAAGQGAGAALARAAAVLVVACPALYGAGVAGASLAALRCGTQNGIIYRDMAALFGAGGAATVLVNQYGAVTTGEPAVAEIQGTRTVPEKFLLSLAAGLEQNYDHPLARAVLRRAQAEGLSCATVTDFAAHPGQGVCGKVAGKAAAGGSAAFVGRYCSIPDAVLEAGRAMEQNGMTALYFALAGHLAGIVGVAEAVKADAKGAVAELKALGLHTVLLSPEGAPAADHIGALIGLDPTEVLAEVPPEAGADAVRSLRDRGAVAVVGDAVDDAAALAAADLTVAENGDVLLLRPGLADLPTAVRLGRAAGAATLQNRRAAMLYNPLAVALAAVVLPPVAAAFLAALAPAAMTACSLRLLRFDPRANGQLPAAPETAESMAMAEELRMAKEMETMPEQTVPTTPVSRRRWVFRGRVQGVGFRYRAQYAAKSLNLTGWVENNWDGSVTLEAQGPEAALDRLVPTITATSQWIMIEDAKEEPLQAVEGERGFHVQGDY